MMNGQEWGLFFCFHDIVVRFWKVVIILHLYCNCILREKKINALRIYRRYNCMVPNLHEKEVIEQFHCQLLSSPKIFYCIWFFELEHCLGAFCGNKIKLTFRYHQWKAGFYQSFLDRTGASKKNNFVTIIKPSQISMVLQLGINYEMKTKIIIVPECDTDLWVGYIFSFVKLEHILDVLVWRAWFEQTM